jgi:hypothetical protein
MTAAASEQSTTRPVGSSAEAELVITHLMDVMDALLAVIEEETALVRGGKLSQAARLEPSKQELSRLYVADTARLKASQPFLAQALPDVLEGLRKRHDLFHARRIGRARPQGDAAGLRRLGPRGDPVRQSSAAADAEPRALENLTRRGGFASRNLRNLGDA